MDWVYLHLVVNHFPIVLIIVGAGAAIVGTLGGYARVRGYARATVLLAALTAPAAFVTGKQAEELVEEAWYVDESQIEEHEELGLIALVGLLVAGVGAGVAWKRPSRVWDGVFLAVTVVAAGFTAYTALEGGEIVHESRQLLETPAVAVPAGDTPRPQSGRSLWTVSEVTMTFERACAPLPALLLLEMTLPFLRRRALAGARIRALGVHRTSETVH